MLLKLGCNATIQNGIITRGHRCGGLSMTSEQQNFHLAFIQDEGSRKLREYHTGQEDAANMGIAPIPHFGGVFVFNYAGKIKKLREAGCQHQDHEMEAPCGVGFLREKCGRCDRVTEYEQCAEHIAEMWIPSPDACVGDDLTRPVNCRKYVLGPSKRPGTPIVTADMSHYTRFNIFPSQFGGRFITGWYIPDRDELQVILSSLPCFEGDWTCAARWIWSCTSPNSGISGIKAMYTRMGKTHPQHVWEHGDMLDGQCLCDLDGIHQRRVSHNWTMVYCCPGSQTKKASPSSASGADADNDEEVAE